MLHRRLAILIACALMLFLGVYTWNQRTGHWDRLCASVGLEFTGGVMRGINGVKDSVTGAASDRINPVTGQIKASEKPAAITLVATISEDGTIYRGRG